MALLHKSKVRDKPSGLEYIDSKGEKKVKTEIKLDEEAAYLMKCI
jgi:hypothetical protein